MSAGSKRASIRAQRILFIASIAIAGAVGGCDNGQNEADKHVRQQLSDARVDAATGQVDAARQKREEAAKDGAASGGVRAAAKAAVAQDQLAIADELSSRIERSELEVVRLVSEISALTEQIRSGGTMATGYKQLDPKPALDKIAADIAAAEGGADKPAWFTNDRGATIPTLAAVKQQLAQLETQINAQQEQINTLTQQRQRVLDDAEKAAADADQLKGSDAVEAFKKGSDLRKQAGDLSVQIDKAQTAITHLKASVATAQAQQQAVNDTINQLKDQAATIEKAWKDVDARVAAQRQLAGKILGESPASSAANPSSTVAQKAAELSRTVEEIKKMRADALAALNSAVTLYDDANKAATEYGVQLNTLISQSAPDRPEVDAWKQMREVMDPAQFRLRQAAALRELGTLQASNATSLRARIALQQALTAAMQANDLRANVSVVNATAAQERGASIAAAEAAFKQAIEILTSIADAMSPSPAKDRVLISRALTNYAYAQLLRQKGDPNQEPLKGSIAKLISSAKADRDLAAEHNPNLPSMPAELGTFKPAPPPSDAAQPAPGSEPATAPSAVNPADAQSGAPAAPTPGPQ
jgi:hypothetical protein